jgi:hypothetical protein
MDIEFAYYNLTLQELVFDMGGGQASAAHRGHIGQACAEQPPSPLPQHHQLLGCR